MKKHYIFLIALIALGALYFILNPPTPQKEPKVVLRDASAPLTVSESSTTVVFPIADYTNRRTLKGFGEYIQDRFQGYHVAEDIEYADIKDVVQVVAIADGEILRASKVAGYGGVVVIRHTIEGQTINAVYGHIALSSSNFIPGDPVKKGQSLANLGEDKTTDTDGERKHLHFALYKGNEIRLQGYEKKPESVSNWINPTDFFSGLGLDVSSPSRMYDASIDRGGDVFNLKFSIPAGWEVEYVPSLKALNLYTLSGGVTARERSQIFIRYFDASQFLTLPTVKIFETSDLKVGKGNYNARRYDIEKKPGVPDFKDQPSWRNERHAVTDFYGKEGFTRYYVVAANPKLDRGVYERVLETMEIGLQK